MSNQNDVLESKTICQKGEWISALKDRAQTHPSTNEALGCWDGIRRNHRNCPDNRRTTVLRLRCCSKSRRIYLAQDVARDCLALIFSSKNAASSKHAFSIPGCV